MKTAIVIAFLFFSTQLKANILTCYQLSQDVADIHKIQRGGQGVEFNAELKDLVARGELTPQKYNLYVMMWDWVLLIPSELSPSSYAKYKWQSEVCDTYDWRNK